MTPRHDVATSIYIGVAWGIGSKGLAATEEVAHLQAKRPPRGLRPASLASSPSGRGSSHSTTSTSSRCVSLLRGEHVWRRRGRGARALGPRGGDANWHRELQSAHPLQCAGGFRDTLHPHASSSLVLDLDACGYGHGRRDLGVSARFELKSGSCPHVAGPARAQAEPRIRCWIAAAHGGGT